MRFNAGFFRLLLMVGVLVFLVVYGKRFSDNFAKKFVSFTAPPSDAGVSTNVRPHDNGSSRYTVPDGSTVSVDEMSQLLAWNAGSPPARRIIDALRHAPSDDIFIARVRALVTVALSKPEHLKLVGYQLSSLLDTPLAPQRLRAVLDALQFLAGKELPPRATIWKNHWSTLDAGVSGLPSK